MNKKPVCVCVPQWELNKKHKVFMLCIYIWLAIWSYYGSIPLRLGLIGRKKGWWFEQRGLACKQRVLKTFPASGYLRSSRNGVIWPWHLLMNLDGGWSTLCHSCGFVCQQRVLKTFPGTQTTTPPYQP